MTPTNKIKIDPKYLPALGRIFTPVVMDSLLTQGRSPYLTEVCTNSGLLAQIDSAMSMSDFFDWIYSFLFRSYRNEYIYKNAIANKILLGRHSLNTSHMLTEFRAGKCTADAVILNGKSTVYEIKSEFDSFSRLDKQLKAYLEIFDHINVITSMTQADKLQTILPEKVGILVLTRRNTIRTIRDSQPNSENVKLEILFESLRKAEYLKIIRAFYGTVPDLPNTQIFRACKKLYSEIPTAVAQSLTIKQLRARGKAKLLQNFIGKAPSSLTAYALSVCNDSGKMNRLMSCINTDFDAVPVLSML